MPKTIIVSNLSWRLKVCCFAIATAFLLFACNSSEPDAEIDPGPISFGTYYKDDGLYFLDEFEHGVDCLGEMRAEIDMKSDGLFSRREYVTCDELNIKELFRFESKAKWRISNDSIIATGFTGRALNVATRKWIALDPLEAEFAYLFKNANSASIEVLENGFYEKYLKK